MPSQPWLEPYAAALSRCHIPIAAQERLLAEWLDHIQDLMEEMPMKTLSQETITRRLGAPDALAQMALSQQRQAPVSVWKKSLFVLLPVPAALAILIALVLVAVAVAEGLVDSATMSRNMWAMVAFGVVLRIAPFAGSAALFAWLAKRWGAAPIWTITACSLIAGLALVFQLTLAAPTNPGTGKLAIGIGFPPTLAQSWQMLAPLAIGTVALIRPWRHSMQTA